MTQHASHDCLLIDLSPLLTAEEEVELARRIQVGDAEARDKLILSNYRLAFRFALRSRCHGLDIEDRLGYAVLGLIKAVDRFDPDAGFRFATCAVPWIRQAIQRAHQRLPLLAIPSGIHAEITYGDGASGKKPNPALVEAGKAALAREREPLDRSVAPSIPDPAEEVAERDEERVRRARLAWAFDELTTREVDVLRLRLGLDGEQMTLTSAGKTMGLSREMVRRIQDLAIEKLRRRVSKSVDRAG